MFFVVGDGPSRLLNVVSVAIVIAAVAVAVESAKPVKRENQSATIAWRVIVSVLFTLVVYGVIVPIGAAYVVVRYGPDVLRRRRQGSPVQHTTR